VALPRQNTLRFGVFEVNTVAREVRKHGVRIRLPGQPFAILVMLLERPGEVVPREEMRRRLWPENTFVDFEHGLNSAVKKLRAALGDSAENPRYIETLPRVGYRFVAPVDNGENGESQVEHAVPPASPFLAQRNTTAADGNLSVSARPRARWAVLAPALTLGVASLSAFLLPRQAPQVVRATRLTSSARADRWGRITSDGARIFFMERRGHRWNLMQMPVAGGSPQAFSEPFENTKIFAVSPDGSVMIVGSFARRGDYLQLPVWLMPSVGGPPKRLADVSARDAVFTPDGREITYSTQDGIFAIDRDGTNPRRLLTLPGRKEALDWSPDGRVLRFQWLDPATKTEAIWEVDAGGQNLHVLLPGWDRRPSQCCGRWTADGRFYIFVSHDHGGAQNIWALREDRSWSIYWRRDPILLSTGPVVMDQPLPSRIGDRLFVLGSNEYSENVRFDPATHEYRGLLGGASATWAAFSSDGQHLASVSNDTLWWSNLDGTSRTEIAPAMFRPSGPRVRPDGREVAFEGMPPDVPMSRIYLAPVDGTRPRELISSAHPVHLPDWSADGRALVYSIPLDAGAAAGLYVFDLETRETRRLPGSEGYATARWSPDGRWIAAVTEDLSHLAVLELRSERWTELDRGRVLGSPVWSRDSKFVYVQDILEEGEPVHSLDVATGRADRIADCRTLLEGDVSRCGFEEITPDGCLIFRLTRGDHDVYALELRLP
jgi:Tol biopolymer transport system component/DNA-binding winged helix-turn-helix (wHTH) protein